MLKGGNLLNKKLIGTFIAILLVGTLVVLMVKSNMEETKPKETTNQLVEDETVGIEQGDTPPDFELTTLDGDVVRLSALKGKKVILNFWASWCGPCKAEMPHMQKYYEKNKDSANVEIVAVNMSTQERKGIEGIVDFVDEYGLTFPIPLDTEGFVIDTYQVISIPTTYMIATDGTISMKIVGPMDENMLGEFVEGLD